MSQRTVKLSDAIGLVMTEQKKRQKPTLLPLIKLHDHIIHGETIDCCGVNHLAVVRDGENWRVAVGMDVQALKESCESYKANILAAENGRYDLWLCGFAQSLSADEI